MRKLLVLGSMFSALVLTGGGCSVGKTTVVPTETNTETEPSSAVILQEPQPTASQPKVVKPKVESTQISIANFAFGPANITVKAGTVVKWVNDDPVLHSINLPTALSRVQQT